METISQQVARQDVQMRQLRATNQALLVQLTGLKGRSQPSTRRSQLKAKVRSAQPPTPVYKRRAPASRPNESGAGVETPQRPPPKKRVKLSSGAEASRSGAAAECLASPRSKA